MKTVRSARQRKRPPRNALPIKNKVLKCNVRKVREAANVSLLTMADAIGMSPAGVSAIEHGNDVQMSSAMKIARFLRVSVSELWK